MRILAYLKKYIDDENVEHVFQRINNTVEHSLQLGYSFDSFQRSEKKKNHKLTIDFLTIVKVLVYLNTLRTLSDLMVLKFVPVEVPLKHKTVLK